MFHPGNWRCHGLVMVWSEWAGDSGWTCQTAAKPKEVARAFWTDLEAERIAQFKAENDLGPAGDQPIVVWKEN